MHQVSKETGEKWNAEQKYDMIQYVETSVTCPAIVRHENKGNHWIVWLQW